MTLNRKYLFNTAISRVIQKSYTKQILFAAARFATLYNNRGDLVKSYLFKITKIPYNLFVKMNSKN